LEVNINIIIDIILYAQLLILQNCIGSRYLLTCTVNSKSFIDETYTPDRNERIQIIVLGIIQQYQILYSFSVFYYNTRTSRLRLAQLKTYKLYPASMTYTAFVGE